jgi:hypothetical protein
MLNALEVKLTAIVAEAVSTRDSVEVVRAAGPENAPAAGSGVIRVTLTELAAEAGFQPGRHVVIGSGGETASRRVLPLRFAAVLRFERVPAGGGDPGAAADTARRLLLEDLSLVGHALADDRVRGGAAFEVGGDPGFEVRSFSVVSGTLGTAAIADPLRGELACGGEAVIWPPVPPVGEGVIETVDTGVQAEGA